MILEGDDKPPFDPLAPLLPEEICWILDRAFACEVNTLRVSPSDSLIPRCPVRMARRKHAFADDIHASLRALSSGHQPGTPPTWTPATRRPDASAGADHAGVTRWGIWFAEVMRFIMEGVIETPGVRCA